MPPRNCPRAPAPVRLPPRACQLTSPPLSPLTGDLAPAQPHPKRPRPCRLATDTSPLPPRDCQRAPASLNLPARTCQLASPPLSPRARHLAPAQPHPKRPRPCHLATDTSPLPPHDCQRAPAPVRLPAPTCQLATSPLSPRAGDLAPAQPHPPRPRPCRLATAHSPLHLDRRLDRVTPPPTPFPKLSSPYVTFLS
jgi:hypothetical protein